VRRTLTLMGPMVFGAGMYQINIMVTTILGSLLPSGSVSCLWYADRVFQFPLGIFAVALGTAALPSFSAQAARGAYDELRHSLAFSMRLTSFIVLPATVGMITLAVPITVVLFQRGAFGFDQALLTAQALSAFAVGLWPVSMVRLVVPAFYAMENTRAPVITAAVAFIANCGFSLLLMGAVAAPGASHLAGAIATLSQTVAVFNLRHTGLALATSLSATVNVILLVLWLRRRLGPLGAGDLMPSLVRSLVASIAMIPAVRYVAGLTVWSQPGALAMHAAVLALAMVVGVVVFTVVALVLGAEEIQSMVRILRQRLGGKRAFG
jgi:putative peptidoglycan lipid II flippase